MATDTTYNGWTNYETWAVKLWIDNEQSSQEYWLERAGYAHANGENEYGTRPAGILADELKQHHEEHAPAVGNGTVYSDLMGAALASVNWYEIAESLIEDAAELADHTG